MSALWDAMLMPTPGEVIAMSLAVMLFGGGVLLSSSQVKKYYRDDASLSARLQSSRLFNWPADPKEQTERLQYAYAIRPYAYVLNRVTRPLGGLLIFGGGLFLFWALVEQFLI